MHRILLSIALVGASVALAGCNQSSGAPGPVAAAPGPRLPNWPALPENAACTESLNNYQKVLTADVATGNLNQSVYDKIEADLARAANACAAGREGEAAAIIRSTKVNHGYRA
ncbi:conserved exported hypothetical protein [Methylocella tundrae]|uniref:Lipoprotein n=1 Tax=Methylocella tundrae TaxID=227605 RepID=A0A4U8YZZ2_METTU|nr:hypothetical protein [Methylocella tundrae]WPP05442.1 hypothetical protein SIN04_06360 [Methylocella tundrae]VFU07857.1 conserved exported protein of unknown function [Methylocella tundrae]VTZ49510.1 conserved exported hypothetical protein [Methylocella tundrae]